MLQARFKAMNEPILIRRSKDQFGWMGNMSPFPVKHDVVEYRTTEALFQCMRFDDAEVIEAIIAEKSPMGAKFVAKRYKERMVVEPCSEQDLDNMRFCLRLKLKCHPLLALELTKTQGRRIIEDCTKRQHGSGLFWGAAMRDGAWHGKNWLGSLWEELREEN